MTCGLKQSVVLNRGSLEWILRREFVWALPNSVRNGLNTKQSKTQGRAKVEPTFSTWKQPLYIYHQKIFLRLKNKFSREKKIKWEYHSKKREKEERKKKNDNQKEFDS